MDQSLEVFWDSFHSCTFLRFKKVKINVFGRKIFLDAFLSNRRACVYNLKNRKYLKFDIRQIFYASLKKKMGKNLIFREF